MKREIDVNEVSKKMTRHSRQRWNQQGNQNKQNPNPFDNAAFSTTSLCLKVLHIEEKQNQKSADGKKSEI